MVISGATDRGMVRSQNQDYFRVTQLGEDRHLAVVCDGMGGGKSGDVASQLASEVFIQDVEHSSKPGMSQAEIVTMLVHAVKNANRAVYEQSTVSPDFAGMGTTLVAAYVKEADAYISQDEVSQLTEDHSVVALMVARGQITEEEARTHPNRNLITRAVGTEPEVECDCFFLRMDPGEQLLLCSDGLSNLVSRPEMLYETGLGGDGTQTCERLIEIARKRGAPDNVTAVLMRF